MVGNLVFRTVRGQTVVSGRPEPTRSKQTARQAKQRDRFADAIAYAQYHLQDPLQRQWYQWFAKARGRRYDKVLVSEQRQSTAEYADHAEYRIGGTGAGTGHQTKAAPRIRRNPRLIAWFELVGAHGPDGCSPRTTPGKGIQPRSTRITRNTESAAPGRARAIRRRLLRAFGVIRG